MKTKPFLLATAGSTVDGRVIDDKLLQEMASSYDPKTYGARLNIEHIRGISGEGPFRAYGDVLELSTAEVDVNFAGKVEKRLGLFGSFDVTDDAKELNEAGQKLYPSIEIEPNFAGKGFAYLMGCALTDSPASIATERLQFNRRLPGALHLARDTASALEPAEEPTAEQSAGFFAKLDQAMDKFFAKFSAAEGSKPDEAAPAGKPGETAAAAFAVADLKPLLTEFSAGIGQEIAALRAEFRAEADSLGVKIKAVEDRFETTPATTYSARPVADGAGEGALF